MEMTGHAQSSDGEDSMDDVVEFIDKYLADPEEVDFVNSTHSVNTYLYQSNDVPESSLLCALNDTKETSTQLDNIGGMEEVAGRDIRQPLSKNAEQNVEENLPPELKRPVDSENKEPSTAIYNSECDLSALQDFNKHQNEQLCAQMPGTRTIHQDGLDYRLQPLHEWFTNVNSGGAYECNAKGTFHGGFQPLPVAQTQHCFQFEQATASALQSNLHPSCFRAMVEGIKLYDVSLNSASNNRVPANSSHPVHSLLHPGSGGNSPLGVSKTSCIALHLNSVNSLTNDHGPIAGLSVQGVSSHLGRNSITCRGETSFPAEDKGHERKAIPMTSSTTSQTYHAIKPLSVFKPAEHDATPYESRNFDSYQSVNLEESNNLNPKRKKKKTSVNNSGKVSKGCSCKKTKCSKLYCECFASRRYCSESCACQGCFNNHELEGTLYQLRGRIKSRNPNAFSPKITHGQNELPINNKEGRRHKRGCNCRKSMCLKKYCECFQANVRCTSGCHCQDCKNVNGREEDPCVTLAMASAGADVGSLEGGLSENLDTTACRMDISHPELYGGHNLTPQTPSFQYCFEMDSPDSWFVARRCLPSPELEPTSFPGTPDTNDMFLEIRGIALEDDSHQRQMNWDNATIMYPFWRDHNAVANHSAVSPSNLPSMAFKINTYLSRIHNPFSGSSSLGPGLPVTPSIQSGETSSKSLRRPSKGGGFNATVENVIPESLKDTFTPIESANVSSHPHGRFVSKSKPPLPRFTSRIEFRLNNNPNGSDTSDSHNSDTK